MSGPHAENDYVHQKYIFVNVHNTTLF